MFNSIKKKIAAETGRDPSDLLPHLLEKLSTRTSSISSLASITTSETDRNESFARPTFAPDQCEVDLLRERLEKLEADKRRLLEDHQNASVMENCLREEIVKLKELLLVQDQQLEQSKKGPEQKQPTAASIDIVTVPAAYFNEQKEHLLALSESLMKLRSEVVEVFEEQKKQLAGQKIDIDNRIHAVYDHFEYLMRLKDAKLDKKKQKIKDLRTTVVTTNFNKSSGSTVAIVAPTTTAPPLPTVVVSSDSSRTQLIATDCEEQWEDQVKQAEQKLPQSELDSDINKEYLRNVLLRFLTSPIDQCRYLVPAVSAALNFSAEEQDLLREHFETKTSAGSRWWFR